MLSNEETKLVRDRIADFVVKFTDALLEGTKEDTLTVMEDFSGFFCCALAVARREGRIAALTTTTN